MIRKVNKFLRQEAGSSKKARMEGKVVSIRGRREKKVKQYNPQLARGNSRFSQNRRFPYKGKGRKDDRFQPYRQETYEAYTPRSPDKGNNERN